jgi:SAM-dependent methyltransferase
MDKDVYHDMTQLQVNHWWFKARRGILDQTLHGLTISDNFQILEIGCGTGGNMEMLEQFGTVYGMEMNEFAASYAREKTGKTVHIGSLPDEIPFDQKFDLICLFDVLEHIEDDIAAVAAIEPLLKPGGKIIFTVPAYQWMFGKHDRLLHHFRRYTRKSLAKIIINTGLSINRTSYFNTFLLPLAVLARFVDTLTTTKESTGYKMPAKIINSALYRIFSLEKYLLSRCNIPAGCSLLLICEKSR